MQTNEPGSLQNKFQDFGAAPSEQLWNSIASNLDEKKKRRGAFWWWFVGAAAFLILLFGVYQFGYKMGAEEQSTALVENENSSQQITTNNNQLTNNSDSSENITFNEGLANSTTTKKNNANAVSQKNENSGHNNSSTNKIEKSAELKILNGNDYKEQHTAFLETVSIQMESPIRETHTDTDMLSSYEAKKIPVSTISKIQQTFAEPELLPEPLVQVENPAPKNNWAIGFNIGTLKGLHSTNQNLMPDPNLSLSSLDNLNTFNSIEGTGIASNANLSETKVDIRRPIQFEFTVEETFIKRGHLQTGLNLGMFFSTNTYNSGSISSVRSKFISIGIPIHFNYDLIQHKRSSFYTGLGLNFEMPIYETVKTSYSASYLESFSTKNFTKGYMISGQFNTGFRFQINQKLKLDFRPNLRYYLHQSMQSVYPALERKIWAGASLGLIWQL